jgi:hypothetical protein
MRNLWFTRSEKTSSHLLNQAQAECDRHQASEDYKTNIQAKEEIEELQICRARIENDKLSEKLRMLNILQEANAKESE